MGQGAAAAIYCDARRHAISTHAAPADYNHAVMCARCLFSLTLSDGSACSSRRQGKVLLFDDSFSHSVDYEPAATEAAGARPQLDGVRVVLVCDLWHPQASRWFPESRRLRPRSTAPVAEA